LLLLLFVLTAALSKEGTLVVSGAAAFTQARADINNDTTNGHYAVTLSDSFATPPVVFRDGATKTIVIRGDGRVRTISNIGGGSLFTVPKGITLILDNNVTLDGNTTEYRIVSVQGGTLGMKDGSTARGSKDSGVYAGGGVFTMSGGAFIKSGGGTIDNTNSAEKGAVAYIYVNGGGGRRDTTAVPGVNLDNRISSSRRGWE
jgi:hypothetical protein